MDIAVFSKAPQPGKVKTRLIPALGCQGAARFQRFLTLNTLQTAHQFSPDNTTLWCAPDTQHRFFQALNQHCAVTICAQTGNCLGERMHRAFVAHNAPLLLIGTDCPALEVSHLETAALALDDGSDAVFIPAEDGGYVLVGLRHPQPVIFENIDWGSNKVMAQTRQRLNEHGLHWVELETLWDIDRPSDLDRFNSIKTPIEEKSG
ncbi:MAG: TIGR04282 family arsenosugar biosynthesis glycosyltransferase [Betaproteobacteria bacterium]